MRWEAQEQMLNTDLNLSSQESEEWESDFLKK